MDWLFSALDHIWNLRALEGHRTTIAQWLLALLAAYQGAATSQEVIGAGLNLPDLPVWLFVPVMAWLAKQVRTFALEHVEPSVGKPPIS